MMERDRRLTGFLRGQTDQADAPPGFEVNNPWKVSLPQFHLLRERERREERMDLMANCVGVVV